MSCWVPEIVTLFCSCIVSLTDETEQTYLGYSDKLLILVTPFGIFKLFLTKKKYIWIEPVSISSFNSAVPVLAMTL
jgi:hypothetical protein